LAQLTTKFLVCRDSIKKFAAPDGHRTKSEFTTTNIHTKLTKSLCERKIGMCVAFIAPAAPYLLNDFSSLSVCAGEKEVIWPRARIETRRKKFQVIKETIIVIFGYFR
jgi:hypothetical protein